MSDFEVIKEQGDYRVVLYHQAAFPDQPDDDGQSPVLRISTDLCSVKHVPDSLSRPYGDDSYIEAAVRRWGTPWSTKWPLVEKYLRAYFGVTQIETYFRDSYWYVTYDSAKWREYRGAETGHASLLDYKAWIEGDVWVYAVQQRVVWASRTENFPYTERVTWEDMADSPSGTFYGYEYVKEAALEALADEVGS